MKRLWVKNLFVTLIVMGGLVFLGTGCIPEYSESRKLAGCDVDVFKIYV